MQLIHPLHADEMDTLNRESAPYALNALIKKTESYAPPPEPRSDELLELEPDLDSLPMRAVLETRASHRPPGTQVNADRVRARLAFNIARRCRSGLGPRTRKSGLPRFRAVRSRRTDRVWRVHGSRGQRPGGDRGSRSGHLLRHLLARLLL